MRWPPDTAARRALLFSAGLPRRPSPDLIDILPGRLTNAWLKSQLCDVPPVTLASLLPSRFGEFFS